MTTPVLLSFLGFALLAMVSTTLGGVCALKAKKHLTTIMGFTAGVVLGVVFFDIFPEIMEMLPGANIPPLWPMLALVGAILLFHLLEKTLLIHHGHEGEYAHHTHPHVGMASALALIGHSFLDGMGIGLAFQVSPGMGFMVALAVIAHDFTDGMNTVALMLKSHNTTGKAKLLLALDALAPVLGALSTLLLTVPEWALVLYLGFFAGFLLYISLADILPSAHSQKSSYRTMAATVLGAGFILVILQVIEG
jgi:ZIP family zinc transporter